MRRFASFALALLIGAAGCGPSQRTLMLEVHARAPIQRLRVVVISRSGANVSSTEHGVSRTPTEVGADVPIRVAITFLDRADVTVHLEGRTAGASALPLVATRCYVVEDQLTDDVLLVPTDATSDVDMDGWPVAADSFCRDPMPGHTTGDMPCDHACGMGVGVDCNGCLPGHPCPMPLPDHDPAIHPGANDLCENGVDEDCDGTDARCVDADHDGFTACGSAGAGGCDCDDRNAAIHPGATDVCGDGVDQDCDGHDSLCDRDGDGYPANIAVGGMPDCDDTNPAIHPGAMEVCTPMGGMPADENCNGQIDELPSCTPDDLDSDGAPRCTGPGVPAGCDCNDCDSSVHPGAAEQCGDMVDQDCNGTDLACAAGDGDHDNFVALAMAGTDCNDMDRHVYPNAPELCGDGISQSCTADLPCSMDTDGDRYVEPPMCEGNPMVTPWKEELCNGIDDDCNGLVDEVPRDAMGHLVSYSGCIISQASDPACVAGSARCALDFQTDLAHCGGCRQACNDATHRLANACVGGGCRCDAGPSCDGSAGMTCCDGAGCRHLADDIGFCGGCGTDCNATFGSTIDACVGGSCSCGTSGMPCAAGDRCCGGVCVHPDRDPLHCGSCNACVLANATPTCTASACVIQTCNGGFDNCDTLQGNGCEQPLNVHDHCGACGTVCDVHGTCGAGSCSCDPGWMGTGTSCSDVNECGSGAPCGANSACTNTPGSYTCACNGGYRSPSGMNNDCVDINECSSTITCHVDTGAGMCTNIPGSFTCTCNPGYTLSGGTCVDINECTTMPGLCGVGTCANSPGTYTCACPGGYSFTGGTCVDINECAAGTPCGAGRGSCANTAGSYVCTCNMGYSAPATGGTCNDVNECASGTPCGSHSACMNTVGSFNCTCSSGYISPSGMMNDCVDLDECVATPTICGAASLHYTCNNTPGSYTCTCTSPWADCTGGAADGCETDESMSPHCGACSGASASCTAGTPKCCPMGATFSCQMNSAC